MASYIAAPCPGTRADASPTCTTVETARLVACMAAEGFTSGIIDVGAATPIVSPVFVLLKRAKKTIDAMKDRKDELDALHGHCTLITTYLIVRCNEDSNCKIDVTPLVDCVDDIWDFSKIYNGRGKFKKMVKMSSDNDRIRELKERVYALVPIMNLGGVVKLAEQFSEMAQELDSLKRTISAIYPAMRELMGEMILTPHQAAVVKLAPVPSGRPADKIWHVARDRVVNALFKGLSRGDGPQVVGLVGRSGSGKTTCAAAVVGDPSETLDCVRARFCDGVIWLRVGRGAGSADRLPALMEKFARTVHEEITGCQGYRPGASPDAPMDGSAYIQDVMTNSQEDGRHLRCLVVADDVWESQVVNELQRTGMLVLLTTRSEALVKSAGGKVVVVDQLTKSEAEFVLRGAAELPAGALLPAAAVDIIDRCDRMAMHLEFVGRWSSVCGSMEEDGWAEAVAAIDAEMNAMRQEKAEGEQEYPFEDRRVAILRAGFLNLTILDAANRALYLALTVMPYGHAFVTKEAAVLLFDDWDSGYKIKKAARVIGILEQWAVVRLEGSLYRMHDAHVKFARSKLRHVHNEDVREPAVRRWRDHISLLGAIVAVNTQTLQEFWRALEAAGGDNWQSLSPYDTALATLDDADPCCIASLTAVVRFYVAESEWARINPIACRLLQLQEQTGDEDGVKNALVNLIHSANGAGRKTEGDEYRSHLSAMLKSDVASGDYDLERHGVRHVANVLGARGEQLDMVRRHEEARESFQRALKIQEGAPEYFNGLEVADTLDGLAAVLNNLNLTEKAAEAYKRSLEKREEIVGHDNLGLTVTMHNLAATLFEMERVNKAAELFERALNIEQAGGGLDNISLYRTIMWLARCFNKLGRHQEAIELRERAQRIAEGATDESLPA